MNTVETKLSSKQIYRGKILALEVDRVRLPDGTEATREVVRHSGGVSVLALDQEDRVLFVRQFRYPYAEELLEIPAGKLEPGESPEACGRRELEEETGHVAGRFDSLGAIYPTPAYVDEQLHLYLARALTETRQRLDRGEFLSVERIPFAQAVDLCLNGTVRDAKTIAAILKYDGLRRRGRI